MLSIIICHRNVELLNALKKNISATIGIPYQLVIIDNSQNQYSIFSAYNDGVKQAIYDIVCFAHEDILFYTNNWGDKVINHFKDPETGMIGVTGGMAQSEIPSAWWYNNYFGKSARNLLMKNTSGNKKKLFRYYSNPSQNPYKTEVAIIDGLWFCIRKSLFASISFDETTFSGFHLYDADISMQVMQYARNYVIYDILIEHKWSGKINKEYYRDLLYFSEKWKGNLPVIKGPLETKYLAYYNWHALRSLILEMKARNFSGKEIKNIFKIYYPVTKKISDSKWFRSYFFLSQFIGLANANRIFYRIEKISGFCKMPDFIKEEYKPITSL